MRLFALVFALFSSPLVAHELWIEPLAYQVPADGRMIAEVVNGEEFAGPKLPYLPQRFAHFVAIAGGKVTPVPGRTGDTPALRMDAPGTGLHVIAYQSRNATVGYATWEKFQKFVTHKDLGDVQAQHAARGLPDADFDEVYSRYSKSLIAVGDGAGSDVRTGLETEIVALTNPYTDDLSGGMRLQLFYRQNVRADEQIEIFEKAPGGAVTITTVRTDGQGIATVSVKPGHSYMADAVVLREPTASVAADTGAVWETLWANLTWAVPG